jgi:hypothetical protein
MALLAANVITRSARLIEVLRLLDGVVYPIIERCLG